MSFQLVTLSCYLKFLQNVVSIIQDNLTDHRVPTKTLEKKSRKNLSQHFCLLEVVREQLN